MKTYMLFKCSWIIAKTFYIVILLLSNFDIAFKNSQYFSLDSDMKKNSLIALYNQLALYIKNKFSQYFDLNPIHGNHRSRFVVN